MKIILWPNPKLKIKSNPVVTPDPNLIAEMFKAMEWAGGIGLSAIQVGVPEMLFVAKIDGQRKVFINCDWSTTERATVPMLEGCVSTPGQFDSIERYLTVDARYMDETMTPLIAHFDGQWAHMIQHEWEHANGMMFTDHMNSATRSRVLGNMMRYKRSH